MGGMIVQEMAKISGDKINKLICYATGSIGDIPGRFESIDASRERLIKEGLPDAVIEIQDLAGDGNHYSATVISSLFSGKSKIEQHKMVYNSLKGKMGNELHALAIKTKEKNGPTS